jgi:hypothetical protein
MVVLVITVLAFLVSLGFNLLQLRWRNEERAARAEDKAEQKRKDDEKEAEQRRREQAAPEFYNYGGTPLPILINGRQYFPRGGPFWDLLGLVTVVNSTLLPMKITPLRLVIAGKDWPVLSISFHVKSNPRDRSDRISLRGNDKEDYELHFRCPDDTCAAGDGELWLASDNRPHEFPVSVRFS